MTIKITNTEEYIDYFKSISCLKESEDGSLIFTIKNEYGRGSITFMEISNYLGLAMTDICLNSDLLVDFELDNTHFEVACCLEGDILMESPVHGEIRLKKDNVILTGSPRGSSKNTGFMRILKNRPYKGISFSFDPEIYRTYHKSIADELWGQLITTENLGPKNIFLAERLPQIGFALLQIFETDFANSSLKKLFIESKIIEVLTQIACVRFGDTNYIRLSESEKEKILTIPDLMMKNASNPDSIESLAGKLHMEVSRLRKGFKYLYGDTIYSYFKKLKLQRAAYMLQTSDKSVLDIALDVGYQSQSRFGSAFKKHYGLTPFEYSRQKAPI